MKVWIDLSNSPHPLLFAPLARRLEEAGASVVLSARDNAQTVELARQRWPGVSVIGGESPGGRAAKARALAGRMRALAAWARQERPDVALSHNSYAQLVVARALRIPAVTAMDFEHQPANHLAFRTARLVLLPEAISVAAVRRQGASPRKVRRYLGLKEELYLGDFEPDGSVLERLGIQHGEGRVLAVARTPPSKAIYHRFANPLFGAALRALTAQSHVRCVALARHEEQRRELEALGLENLIVPAGAVDARSLVREADLVIGAGGTMTREAALMGTPAYSVFAGKRPAVDAWLEERGALRRLRSADELRDARPREAAPVSLEELRERGRRIEDAFVDAVLSVADGGRNP